MTTLVVSIPEPTADQRWEEWVARGAAQDRISHRRAVRVAITIACAIAVWLAIALARG